MKHDLAFVVCFYYLVIYFFHFVPVLMVMEPFSSYIAIGGIL